MRTKAPPRLFCFQPKHFMKKNRNAKIPKQSATHSSEHSKAQRLHCGDEVITAKISFDDGELRCRVKEISEILKSLAKLRNRIRLRLLDLSPVGKPYFKTTICARNRIVQLHVPRSLEKLAVALRTLNVFDAHNVLDGKSQLRRKYSA